MLETRRCRQRLAHKCFFERDGYDRASYLEIDYLLFLSYFWRADFVQFFSQCFRIYFAYPP